jgi:hypothetical protein
MNEVLDPGLLGGGEQRAGSLDIDVSGRPKEVTEREAAALRSRGVGRRVDDRLHAPDCLAYALAGCQIALDPLKARVDVRLAGEDPHAMTIAHQPRRDRAAQMSGTSCQEDSQSRRKFLMG